MRAVPLGAYRPPAYCDQPPGDEQQHNNANVPQAREVGASTIGDSKVPAPPPAADTGRCSARYAVRVGVLEADRLAVPLKPMHEFVGRASLGGGLRPFVGIEAQPFPHDAPLEVSWKILRRGTAGIGRHIRPPVQRPRVFERAAGLVTDMTERLGGEFGGRSWVKMSAGSNGSGNTWPVLAHQSPAVSPGFGTIAATSTSSRTSAIAHTSGAVNPPRDCATTITAP